MTETIVTPVGAETIGARLKRLRHDAGLSQRDLQAPGVSYAYISRIEAGTRQPSVKALRRLAERLGVTADYLEYGDAAPVVVAATAEKIDEAVRLYVGEDAPKWESLTEEERRMVTVGLEDALLDTLAARIYVAKKLPKVSV